MAKAEQVARLWTRESILDVENKILQQVMSARTPEGYQASIAFARFLRTSGLDVYNSPLFLKMLEIENHWILDALIHSGKAKPMILVMPDAHPIPPKGEPFEEYGPKNTDAFCKEMLEDIVPFVEENYSVQTSASGRAFAGLSMGGLHALTIALSVRW